jgi:hypothetical protein
MTESTSTGSVRVSDAERARVAALLEQHCTAGRLTMAELDERVATAYAARTRNELAALLADLPGSSVEPATAEYPVDSGLRCLLWWVCPPVGFAYWLSTRRARRLPEGAPR